MTTATGAFEIANWDEDVYLGEAEGRRLSRADVTQRFHGGIEGEGRAQWLMAYLDDGTARFVGMQHVEGTLDGRRGSAVFETDGEFDGAQAKGNWRVVEGSGTDGWTGIRGEGGFAAPHGSTATYSIVVRDAEGPIS